jgi:serine/threonine-protein kinase
MAAPKIPGYEVQRLLGKGGMGEVYRARDLTTGQVVAIKWLPAQAPETTRLRFEREARATAVFSHRNVVSFYRAGTTELGLYIAMELVPGDTLDKVFKAGSLQTPAIVAALAKVADALATGHAAGVIHRDVKPANVIIDTNNEPRVIDFGLARILTEVGTLTGESQILGTIAYMSPEVAAGGASRAGPPSDVYSLGAVLYETLSGRPPCVAKTARETLVRISSGVIDPLPASVPEALAARCLACLSKDPVLRPEASELATFLAEAAPGVPHVERIAALDLQYKTTHIPTGPTEIFSAEPAPAPPERRLLTRGVLLALAALLGIGAIAGTAVALLTMR